MFGIGLAVGMFLMASVAVTAAEIDSDRDGLSDLLVADGVPTIEGSLSGLYITDPARDLREIEIRFSPEEFQAMREVVASR